MLKVAICLLHVFTLSFALENFVEHHTNSFRAPFKKYDASGARTIQAWVTGGDAVVHENFIRLTNDRSRKKGWIFNTDPLKVEDWTLYLKFRMSGQGENLFADGFGLWVVNNTMEEFDQTPELYGAPGKVNGFGVIFDTYKNEEMQANHRDVMIVVGDGSVKTEMHHVLPTGCNVTPAGAMRHWEGRDDFSVSKSFGLAKISFKAKSRELVVQMDASAKGTYEDCLSYTFSKEQVGHMENAHLAISASTGQLADNHDILSLSLTHHSGSNPSDIFDWIPNSQEIRDLEKGVNNDAVVALIRAYALVLREDTKKLDHNMEHTIASVRDNINNTIEAIKKGEDQNRRQLSQLVTRLDKKNVANTQKLVNKAKDELQEKMKTEKESLREDIMDVVVDGVEHAKLSAEAATKDLVSKNTGGWKLPMFLISCGIILLAFIGHQRYQKIMKTHMF